MDKFLIEVRHGGDKASCLLSIQSFLAARSHFVSGVEFGCIEGEQKTWLILKTKNPEDAMKVLPAAYQQNAKITKLHKLSIKQIDEALQDLS